jgi:hypothetical protein
MHPKPGPGGVIPLSVMAYITGEGQRFENREEQLKYKITERDAAAAQTVYGPPSKK